MHLDGLTILVVEDEPLIAMDVMDTLERAGATVLGPERTLADVFSTLDDAGPGGCWDAVVLDFNLPDGETDNVATRLKNEGIAFFFHTGSSEKLRPLIGKLGVPVLSKPASEAELIAAVLATKAPRADETGR